MPKAVSSFFICYGTQVARAGVGCAIKVERPIPISRHPSAMEMPLGRQ